MNRFRLRHITPAGLAALALTAGPIVAQTNAQADPPPATSKPAPEPRTERTPPPPKADPAPPPETDPVRTGSPRPAGTVEPPRDDQPGADRDPRPAKTGTVRATTQSQGIRVREMLGVGVAIQDGHAAGKVYDLIVNNQGMIEYVLVEDAGQLTSVPWRAVRIDVSPDATPGAVAPAARPRSRLSIPGMTADRYRTAPRFARDAYPDFYHPDYNTEATQFYNLRPSDPDYLDRGVLSGATRDGPPAGIRPPVLPGDREDNLPPARDPIPPAPPPAPAERP